jgi:hypothetical protein
MIETRLMQLGRVGAIPESRFRGPRPGEVEEPNPWPMVVEVKPKRAFPLCGSTERQSLIEILLLQRFGVKIGSVQGELTLQYPPAAGKSTILGLSVGRMAQCWEDPSLPCIWRTD